MRPTCLRLPCAAMPTTSVANSSGATMVRTSRMKIVRVGELRQPIELLAAFRPLVDAWIEIDEMHAGRARGGEMNDNVTAGIEAARISHVCVVVRRHVDVVVFGPADTLEMNRDGR